WSVQQVDGLLTRVSRTCNVFRAPGKRQSEIPFVSHQEGFTPRGSTLQDAHIRIGGDRGILNIRLNDPRTICVCVDEIVNAAVVRERSGEVMIGRLPEVATRFEGQLTGFAQ